MARAGDREREMRDATRDEGCSLHGPNRIVKVVPLGPVGLTSPPMPPLSRRWRPWPTCEAATG